VEVAANSAGVAGLADGADPLAGPDAVAAADRRRADQVRVEVAAALALTADREEVAVEDRVIADPPHTPGRHGEQRRATGGNDVEALVGAPAAARRAELADVTALGVRPGDREDVVAELDPAAGGVVGCCGSESEEGEKERMLQWCSMTRSTRLYSFASSALMK